MTDRARYRSLRWSILGFGIGSLAILAWITVDQWQAIWPWLQPQVLGCGCQTLAVQISPWLTGWASFLFALTAVLLARFGWFLARGMLQQSRLLNQFQVDGRMIMHGPTGEQFLLIPNQERVAMTVGIWQPRIVVSHGLLSQVAKSELTAILRHEQAHRRAGDSAWSIVLQAIGQTWFKLPWLAVWIQAAWRLRELVADGVASMNYTRTTDLTSAFLKLAPAEPSAVPSFTPNLDRVEKLLNPQWVPQLGLWRRSAWLSGLAVVAGLLLFFQVSTTTAKTSTQTPAGLCQATMQMCRGQAFSQPTQTTVCIEQNGWRCTELSSMSVYELRLSPR